MDYYPKDYMYISQDVYPQATELQQIHKQEHCKKYCKFKIQQLNS